MCGFASRLGLPVILAAAWGLGGPAWSQPTAWYEGFEGPEVSWKLVGGNAQYRVDLHQRLRGEAHTGDGCERLRVTGAGGTEVYFGHEVGHPRVIDDLLPTVWVRADRPGMQLAAQVVLPRSRDPRTGAPVSTLLQGTSYTTVGRWQQLRLEGIPRLLDRKTPLLRTQLGPGLDPREAYVERVLLNVYGGPGATNLWIDDLDLAGYVGPPPGSTEPPVRAPVPDWWAPAVAPATVESPEPAQAAGRGPEPTHRVKVIGSALTINGRPLFPRVIQHQGEPFAWLKQLRFNAVWLPRIPTAEMLQEADRLKLWLVCPPPRRPEWMPPEGAKAPVPEIGPEYDRVLAWDLGSGLGSRQLPAIEHWAEQVRTADRRQSGRPLVCRPTGELRAYSRSVQFLILGRDPLGSSLELSHYDTWLRQRPRLARPGTPVWTSIPTQPAEGLQQQWSALGHAGGLSALPSEQVRLLVYTAIAAGSRGLVFESRSPLSASDPDTRQRALTAELLNLEIDLAEPWAAAGSLVDAVPGSEPGIVAAELQAERARLLVAVWSAPRSQHVAGQAAGRGVSFVVPGVPESCEAYQLLPGGVPPLVYKRVALGMRVTLDEFGLTGLVLLTQDPRAMTELTRRAGEIGKRAAEVQRELAWTKLQTVAEVSKQISSRIGPVPQAAEWMTQARRNLQQCDALLAARDAANAYVYADRAMRSLRLLERAQWDRAVAPLRSPVVSPAAVFYQTLPAHFALAARITGSQPSGNLLPGGDFEDVAGMFQSGWQHVQHATPGIESTGDLTPAAAHSGRFGLRLEARPAPSTQAPALVESPPVWLVSPSVAVEAGQLLRIQGWVQVPKPITGSVDGVMIVDSLAGEPLAERVYRTAGWERFALYRVAPRAGPMSVAFVLTGLGEVWLDDVTIEPLLPGGAAPAVAAKGARGGGRETRGE